MGVISVEDLKPGMRLRADVKSAKGRMLLPKGVLLEQTHIKTCKVWGLLQVDVEDVSTKEVAAAFESQTDPETLKAAKRVVARKFRLAGVKHPALLELARLYLVRAVRDIATAQTAAELTPRPPPAPAPATAKPVTLEAVLRKDVQLASLPHMLVQILEAVNNPRVAAAHIAEIIGKDVSLSTRLLKLVNSPFYGFPHTIDTLSRAVTLIGHNQIVNLGVGISMVSLFKDIPPELVDMHSFWKHSLACGTIARLLAATQGPVNEERFFIAGLLHDIGQLVLFKNYPAQAFDVVQRALADNVPLHEAETAAWGFDHATLGGRLLKRWKFPASLESAVRGHHTPDSLVTPASDESLGESLGASLGASTGADVVHVADVAAHSLNLGASGNQLVPPLCQASWERLGISKTVLPTLLGQAETQLARIVEIFTEAS